MSKKALTRGSLGRVYRDGHHLMGNVDIPAEGPFTVRSFAPGNYVVRDEAGGEADFTVSAYEEVTTVKAWPGDGDGGTEPGSSTVTPFGDGERDTRPWNPLDTPGYPNVGPDRPAPAAGEDDRPGKASKVKVQPDEPLGAPGHSHTLVVGDEAKAA